MSRLTWVGCGVVAAALWSWSALAPAAYTATAPAPFGSRELITHFQDQATGPTVLTVVDPQARAVAVYHIERETGKIEFKSVRNFEMDLRLSEFNSGQLSPEDIRKMLERQQ